MSNNAADFVYRSLLEAIPTEPPGSVVAWAEEHVRLIGSPFGERFKRDTMPWVNAPIECAADGTRTMALVKPIQTSGSTAAEIALLYWLAHWQGGNIGSFWPNDAKADERWSLQTEKILRACKPVMARLPDGRFNFNKGMVIFDHLNFVQLGARTDRNVASTPFRGIWADELHDQAGGWDAGKLQQVMGRMTAFWNSVLFLISNASRAGDEFHTAFLAGTQQHWQVLCPGCKQFHVMRTRWKDEEPTLGGLRYDATGCRLPNHDYNYTRLVDTIYYQMPCGAKIHDDVSERRALSLSGRYSEPQNKGALLVNRSFTYEAVTCDHVSWLSLIKQKHTALKALKQSGNPSLLEIYEREQECRFWDVKNSRPEAKPIVLSTAVKDRNGLPNRQWRLASVDYQVGRAEAEELPHFWACVADFDAAGNSLIVYEGKSGSEGELLDVLRRHDVRPICTLVDASYAGAERYVYGFCLRFKFNALKVMGDRGGQPHTFTHADSVRRFWSEPEPLWPHLPGQAGPVSDDPALEPEFWLASQAGALNALAHARASTERKYEIPSDVSPEFLEHFKAWSPVEVKVGATNETIMRWKKVSERAPDHLYMCCSYLAIWAERLGIYGNSVPVAAAPAEPEGEQQPVEQPLSIDDRLAMM